MTLFGGDKDTVFDAEMITEGLEVKQKIASLALGRLAAKGKLEKVTGGYRLAGNIQGIPAAKAS